MPLPSTILETVDTLTVDALHPILCDDNSGHIPAAADFVFDALNPACYADDALPAVDAVIPDAGLKSLVSGSTKTAVPSNLAKKPTFDGKGWKFDAGSTAEYIEIRKSGVANNRVAEPTLEGFVSTLALVYHRANSEAGLRSSYFTGAGQSNQTGGFWSLAGGNGKVAPQSLTTSRPGFFNVGAWNMLGVHTVFYIGSSQITLRSYLNGEPYATQTVASTQAEVANNSSARAHIGKGQLAFDGSVARIVRLYTDTLTEAEIDAFVSADWAWKYPQLIGG